jgi:hypothetical protein
MCKATEILPNREARRAKILLQDNRSASARYVNHDHPHRNLAKQGASDLFSKFIRTLLALFFKAGNAPVFLGNDTFQLDDHCLQSFGLVPSQ